MVDDRIILTKGRTDLVIARPDTDKPYYRGTRFDRSGNILNIRHNGHNYVSQWFRVYDPYKHDAVGGTAEEFTQIGYDKAEIGRAFLKIGVGLLKKDDLPYDRFRLYEIIDPGIVKCTFCADRADFENVVGGHYTYKKRICLPEEGAMKMEHSLRNDSGEVLETYVYCHNFFVLDGAKTGRATRFTLPFRPTGHWRSEYDSVHLTDDGIVFDRDLNDGESVFMGDLHAADDCHRALAEDAVSARPDNAVTGYRFQLQNLENSLGVHCSCDAAMEYAVFWSNQDVSCLEPYVKIRLEPRETFCWAIDYSFVKTK